MMTIRPTTAQDWRTLKHLRLAALLDAPQAFGLRHETAVYHSDAVWRERAAGTADLAYFVGLIGDDAAAMAGAWISPERDFKLISMWTKPEYRGTGVAASLVEAVKARAVDMGHTRVVLSVAAENIRAVALYRRQGFSFLPEWEPLASNPTVSLQTMLWQTAPG
ncbi:GNAT family N-acetyltransferase [Massilia soli]|uniref:GNAT family N-acetyltransferase n=1 Tax=Massilia soli TaxID=2792854 RepID=A0ABS7SS06_9BURK|nr:GNAT family N-acetyltransferase [Massilia soli]MBZ2208720.1 GNAT family N-acetyltransferase [Massilia soli]